MHYLDNSATTPVLKDAADMALRVMCGDFGNPSSQHRLGIAASGILKTAREHVSNAMGVTAREVIFTSCGTESINTALFGACRKNSRLGKHIISTEMEHAATQNALKKLHEEGFEITYLKPDGSGHIDAKCFADALREDTILVTCMLVNNEVGSVFPVGEIGKLLKKKCPKAFFHIDAVQGFFRIPLTPQKWNCDLMSVSGHKIGAPKGIGALYMRHGVKIPPLLYGGGQEWGFRPGTEPLPNIAAFGEACRLRSQTVTQDSEHAAKLGAYLKQQIAEALPFAEQNGKNDIPHVQNYSLLGCKSEVMLRILETEEVYVSAGSACSKGHESPVLRAMQLSQKRIDSALRISLAPWNTQEDIDAFIKAAQKGAAILRR